jgi:NAD-dependent dihydropyrimidine dehydrogenase PreA subunit
MLPARRSGTWGILPDRPNEQDFAVAREYAALALKRFSQNVPAVFWLQKPFGYNRAIASLENQKKKSEREWTHPTRIVKECSMCRDCETECPAKAFNADTGLSEPKRCIECMHCVYICPDKVLKVDGRLRDAYESFLTFWHLTEDMINAKRSRIITEALQTSC